MDYDELPDQIMIYIGDTDIWKYGRTIYEFQMIEIHVVFPINDGLREIFVNTEVNDGTAIAQLMHYFTTADPYDMSQGDLSQKVNYYKVSQEGKKFMKSLSQQIYEDGRSEGNATGQGKSILTYMRKNNCELEAALKFFDIDETERRDIEKFVLANL